MERREYIVRLLSGAAERQSEEKREGEVSYLRATP